MVTQPTQDGYSTSAAEFEKRKTPEQRAEDVAYTINHSIYCTLTDFLNPPINAATDGYLRWLIPGCGHDHSKDGHVHGPHCNHDHDHGHGAYSPSASHGPGCNHDKPLINIDMGGAKKGHDMHCGHEHPHHDHAPKLSRWEKVKAATKRVVSKERVVQYFKGEFIGDFGAVIPTIMMQRYMPGTMDSIRKLSEPVMGPVFKWGIEQDSKRWAKQHLIDTNSAEYKQHVNDVYEHEMRHFPQAVAWTGWSLALNTAYQVHADKSAIKLPQKILLKGGSCLAGITVTAGVVVAARALAPHRMRNFDQWSSKTVILPVTHAVGRLFGVNKEAVQNMAAEQEKLDHGSWAERVAAERKAATEHHVKHCNDHPADAGVVAR